LGVLTVGVVTKPFQFEGAKRMRQAEEGVEVLQRMVDTLIIIPNQNLFRLANEKTTFTEAFSLADDVLYQGVKGVTDLMVRPGLINLDFADVRAVMDEMGKAMMGTGEGEGEDRAVQAAEKAIANPLLDEISLKGAKGVLINITGGYDLTLFELDEAANRIREEVDPDANIIVGSTLDTDMEGAMRVSVVATGIDAKAKTEDTPMPRRHTAAPQSAMAAPAAAAAAPAAPAAEPQVAASIQQPEAHAPAPQEAAQEPSLFHGMDEVPAPRMDDDGLPPPAYQPQAQPQPAAEHIPGTASAETMARLQAAVQNRPEHGAPAQPAAAAPAAPSAEPRPRFAINGLINRMTGTQAAPTAQPPRQQPQIRTTQPAEEAEADPEQERIEIPAFLRRQAN
jgi:cell division protein FtsZ